VLFGTVRTVEKKRFQSSAKRQISIVFFSVQLAAGSMLSIRCFPVCLWDDSEDWDTMVVTGWNKLVT